MASGRPRNDLAGAEIKQEVLHDALYFTMFLLDDLAGAEVGGGRGARNTIFYSPLAGSAEEASLWCR